MERLTPIKNKVSKSVRKSVRKTKTRLKKFISKKKNQRKLTYTILVILVVGLLSSVVLLQDKARAERQEYQQLIENKLEKLEEVDHELRELKEENGEKERKLREQEKEYQRQIKELEKLVEARKERERRLALANQAQAQQTSQASSLAGSGDCAAEIAKYDWPQDWAMAVMMKESTNNPGAHNFSHATRDDSWGCFQINLYPPNNETRPSASWLVIARNNVSLAYEWYVRDGRTFCGQWPNTC